MQRREQQRRAASGMGSGGGFGGGVTGYSPVPRYEAPEPPVNRTPATTTSNTPRAPAFKGSGMKLGAKKTKQNELLDALGASAPYEAPSAPVTPAVEAAPSRPAPVAQSNDRGSVPDVEREEYVLSPVIYIRS